MTNSSPSPTHNGEAVRAALQPFTAERNIGVSRHVDTIPDDTKTERYFTYGQFRAVSRVLAALAEDRPDREGVGHDCYEIGKPNADAPKQIKDRNGVVVLQYCKRCGEFEAGLDGPCATPPHSLADHNWADLVLKAADLRYSDQFIGNLFRSYADQLPAATPDTALKEAGEAVAWRIWGGQEWVYSDCEPGVTHRHVEPLYAHPPRSSALPAGGSSGHGDGEVKS